MSTGIKKRGGAVEAMRPLLRSVRRSPIGPYINIPRRAILASSRLAPPLARMAKWLLVSREDTNFTYPLTDLNMLYLAHFIALVVDRDIETVEGYFAEVAGDEHLRRHILEHVSRDRSNSDMRVDFGRRLGWYAITRALKPELVIETGVDKGLGSVTLCAALLKNGTGRFIGTDINPTAGRYLDGIYSEVGRIAYGDSIETLKGIDQPIDLFVNDSDHSAAYEAAEYVTVENRLSPSALVISDNANSTDALAQWSRRHGRRFMFWREQPKDHWYPGEGIGISVAPSSR